MTESTGPRSVERIAGNAIAVRGNDIDTDRIMPARYLRCVTFEGLEDHVFEDDRKDYRSGPHPFDRPEYRDAAILVVNRNFGCGSSREHAPQGLYRRGIRGIVGESFAEIFFGNCVALGVPCVTLPPNDVAELQRAVDADPDTRLEVDLRDRVVRVGSRAAGEEEVRALRAGLPEGARKALLEGIWDSTGLLLYNPEDVDRVAASLPYAARWGAPAGRTRGV